MQLHLPPPNISTNIPSSLLILLFKANHLGYVLVSIPFPFLEDNSRQILPFPSSSIFLSGFITASFPLALKHVVISPIKNKYIWKYTFLSTLPAPQATPSFLCPHLQSSLQNYSLPRFICETNNKIIKYEKKMKKEEKEREPTCVRC